VLNGASTYREKTKTRDSGRKKEERFQRKNFDGVLETKTSVERRKKKDSLLGLFAGQEGSGLERLKPHLFSTSLKRRRGGSKLKNSTQGGTVENDSGLRQLSSPNRNRGKKGKNF